MIILFRIYLYWTILWGVIPYLFQDLEFYLRYTINLIDVAFIVICVVYIFTKLSDVNDPVIKDRALRSVLVCVILPVYGIAVTSVAGGAVLDASFYLAALVRSLVILTAASILISTTPPKTALRALKNSKIDILIMVALQLSIATIQKIDPDLGSQFVPTLSDFQSGVRAMAQGDTPGMMANSIDLAYFLLAAFMVLTFDRWFYRRALPLIPTTVFALYIYWTASRIALICFILYVALSFWRTLNVFHRNIALTSLFLGLVLFTNLFYSTIEYNAFATFDDLMLSRLGFVLIAVPELLARSPELLWIGFGADFELIDQLIKRLPNAPLVFLYSGSAVVINDVFWVALILSLGAPISLFFLYTFKRSLETYLSSHQNDTPFRSFAHLITALILFAGFFNQILIVKTFFLTFTVGLLPWAMLSFHHSSAHSALRRKPSVI